MAEEMRSELAALRVENEALRTANAQLADDDWEPHPSLFAKRGETIGHVVKPERYKALLAAEAEAAHLRAENANLRDRVRDAEKAMRPFAGSVFNDNGDVTISTGHLTAQDWLAARRFHLSFSPEPQEAGDHEPR
ncbi:hypothetical protein SB2_25590 [Methylobacterium radiotolerans]|nr:hypothetical protein SB3_28315 [Methylobacterium radiotolerans]KTS44109.1 hypothetical protein SB2_25590 [Methylobacterium radiotolerans]